MPGHKGVVRAFLRVREAGQAAAAAQRIKPVVPAGQQFMRVALVPHVEQQRILRQVQLAVQRHRQLHHAQIGGQMPARAGDGIRQHLTDLGTKLLHLRERQLPQVGRAVDL